jgi:predicted Zn-dependent peptidase
VGGSQASVTRLTREEIVEYVRRQYAPQNTVLAVAAT